MAFTTSDRIRLLKFLELLASDHLGERSAAGLAAVRLLRERKLSWSDVIAFPAPIVLPTSRPAPSHWRQLVQACLRQPGGLRQWEARFLSDLLGFSRVSPKQLAIVNEIAARLGVLAECAA